MQLILNVPLIVNFCIFFPSKNEDINKTIPTVWREQEVRKSLLIFKVALEEWFIFERHILFIVMLIRLPQFKKMLLKQIYTRPKVKVREHSFWGLAQRRPQMWVLVWYLNGLAILLHDKDFSSLEKALVLGKKAVKAFLVPFFFIYQHL